MQQLWLSKVRFVGTHFQSNIGPTILANIKIRPMLKPLRLPSRKPKAEKSVQFQLASGGYDQSGQYHDHEGVPKTSQGTQYKGGSSYVFRQSQAQLACGANGMVDPNITCHYCKYTGCTKDNCVQLNSKIAPVLQTQEQPTTAKLSY